MDNSWRDIGWAIGTLAGVLLLLSGCRAAAPIPPRALSTTTSQTLPVPKKPNARLETIYFLKGNASLSPGALDKLRRCVTTWGLGGRWTLASPANTDMPKGILDDRVMALRTELRDLGVQEVAAKILPEEPIGKYDAVYVLKEVP